MEGSRSIRIPRGWEEPGMHLNATRCFLRNEWCGPLVRGATCEHHPSGSLNSKEGPAAGAWLLWHSVPRAEQNSDQMTTDNRCSWVSAALDTRKSQGTAHSVLSHGRKHRERECWEHAERTLELARLKNGTSAEACMTSKETHPKGKVCCRIQVQVLLIKQAEAVGTREAEVCPLRRSILGFEGQLVNQGKAWRRLTVERFTARNRTGNCFKRSVETAFFTSLTRI